MAGHPYVINFNSGSCAGTITKIITFTYTAGACGPGDSGAGTATLSIAFTGSYDLTITIEVDGNIFTANFVGPLQDFMDRGHFHGEL